MVSPLSDYLCEYVLYQIKYFRKQPIEAHINLFFIASDKTVDFIMSQMPYVDIRYIPTIRSGSADITLSR